MNELLQAADVARIADVTTGAVHRAVLDGRLRVRAKTRRGTRLFDLAEAERYRRTRDAVLAKGAARRS